MAHRLALGDAVHRGKAHFRGIDDRDAAAALDFEDLVRADERGGVLVQADADRERVVGKRRDQAAEAVALRGNAGRSRSGWSGPRPGASRTLPAITDEPSSPNAIMCSLRMLAPALVPPTVTPCGVAPADQLRDRRAAEQRREAQLVAAGEEDAAGLLDPLQAIGLLAVAARVEVHHVDARGAEVAEQRFVARAGLVHPAGGRDDDDVGFSAAGNFDEARAGCGGRSPCSRRRRSGRSSRGLRLRQLCWGTSSCGLAPCV